jgi:hypothetical protein
MTISIVMILYKERTIWLAGWKCFNRTHPQVRHGQRSEEEVARPLQRLVGGDGHQHQRVPAQRQQDQTTEYTP